MFKKGSYNVKKAEGKSSQSQPSSSVKSKAEASNPQTSTATLKKEKSFWNDIKAEGWN